MPDNIKTSACNLKCPPKIQNDKTMQNDSSMTRKMRQAQMLKNSRRSRLVRKFFELDDMLKHKKEI
tara:strand:+ start:1505 stop:1702 length:198 start_codon:yes stop_codon:yes gene_type:complete